MLLQAGGQGQNPPPPANYVPPGGYQQQQAQQQQPAYAPGYAAPGGYGSAPPQSGYNPAGGYGGAPTGGMYGGGGGQYGAPSQAPPPGVKPELWNWFQVCHHHVVAIDRWHYI